MWKNFFFFVSCLLSLVPLLAFAQTTGQVDLNAVPDIASPQAVGGGAGFINWVQNFYQFSLIAGVFLAVGVITWAGLKYALAAGNPSGQSDARDQILQALLGLILLFGAYLILFTINPNLVNLSLPTLSSVSVGGPTNSWGAGVGVGTGTGTFQGSGGTSGGGGAGACTTCLTDSEARQALNSVTIRSGVSLQGLQPSTVNLVTDLKNSCASCNVTITSGTNGAHSTSGLYSHSNGYKIDMALDPTLNNYVTNNFTYTGVRSDGAPMYRAPDGAIYAKEYNHWDVVLRS